MSTEELKPCPFCGGRSLEIGLLGVECESCDAVGPSGKDGLDMLSTIAAWNSRVAESDAAGARRWVGVLPVQEPTTAASGMRCSNCDMIGVRHESWCGNGEATTEAAGCQHGRKCGVPCPHCLGFGPASEAITPKEPPPTRAYMKDGMRILGVVCQQCGNEETISDVLIVEPAHDAALVENAKLREDLMDIANNYDHEEQTRHHTPRYWLK